MPAFVLRAQDDFHISSDCLNSQSGIGNKNKLLWTFNTETFQILLD